jgi:hypothetical protein
LRIVAARRKRHLKQNVIGIVGGIIALISLALPWWTMTASTSAYFFNYSGTASIYPYQATANYAGVSAAVNINIWYGWAALILVVFGGLMGIIGSIARNARTILVAGGLLALLSIIVFAVGLQNALSSTVVLTGYPIVGLFSSGSLSGYANYSTYLSYGFWLALVAAITMLVASLKKPEVIAAPLVPLAPPTTPVQSPQA